MTFAPYSLEDAIADGIPIAVLYHRNFGDILVWAEEDGSISPSGEYVLFTEPGGVRIVNVESFRDRVRVWVPKRSAFFHVTVNVDL